MSSIYSRQQQRMFATYQNNVIGDTEIFGCDVTPTGICPKVSNVQECINECKKHPDCYYGNFFSGNGTTICQPVRHLGFFSPYDVMVQKDQWPQLRQSSTMAFVNTDKFPNPLSVNDPTSAVQQVYYGDSLALQEIGSGKYLQLDGTLTENMETDLTVLPAIPFGVRYLSFLPFNPFAPFVFNRLGTHNILKKVKGKLTWVAASTPAEHTQNIFKVSIPEKQKLSYNAPFELQFGPKNQAVGVEKGRLTIGSKPTKFRFIPNVTVAQCGESCKPWPIRQDSKLPLVRNCALCQEPGKVGEAKQTRNLIWLLPAVFGLLGVIILLISVFVR